MNINTPTSFSNLVQPREQINLNYPDFTKTGFNPNISPTNYMNNQYNMYYMQMQQQQMSNSNIPKTNIPDSRFQAPNYQNPMMYPPITQQPILQTNYINNVNIYSNFTPQVPQNNFVSAHKIKSGENQTANFEKTSTIEEANVIKTGPQPTSQISPDIYNRIISNQEYHPYIPSSLNATKVKGHAPTISDLYDSTCFLNTNITGPHDSSNKEKKSSSIDDFYKRIERMSLNENYNLNDFIMNNEFVNYVYNYRFSVNDKEEISNQILKFSQNQQRSESIGPSNQVSADKDKTEKKQSKDELDTEETEQDENSSPFNYNSYYNSLFGNSNPTTD